MGLTVRPQACSGRPHQPVNQGFSRSLGVALKQSFRGGVCLFQPVVILLFQPRFEDQVGFLSLSGLGHLYPVYRILFLKTSEILGLLRGAHRVRCRMGVAGVLAQRLLNLNSALVAAPVELGAHVTKNYAFEVIPTTSRSGPSETAKQPPLTLRHCYGNANTPLLCDQYCKN